MGYCYFQIKRPKNAEGHSNEIIRGMTRIKKKKPPDAQVGIVGFFNNSSVFTGTTDQVTKGEFSRVCYLPVYTAQFTRHACFELTGSAACWSSRAGGLPLREILEPRADLHDLIRPVGQEIAASRPVERDAFELSGAAEHRCPDVLRFQLAQLGNR